MPPTVSTPPTDRESRLPGPAQSRVGATSRPKRLVPLAGWFVLPILFVAFAGGVWVATQAVLGGLEHGPVIGWVIAVPITIAAVVYFFRHRRTGRSR